MDCLKRKHPKKREHKKPHPPPPHVSPVHSQPSTLANYSNGSLPKVSSTGLWMNTPSVYAVNPPQSYYYDRPHGYDMRGVTYPYHISRATSETQIPPLVPMAPRQFYHSQPLAPVYELPPTHGMEIYDYPYAGEIGGMRSKMLETRHTPEYYNNNSEFMLRARVERAKSDAENRRPSKPPHKKEPPKQNKTASQDSKKSSPRDNLKPSWAKNDVKLLTSPKNSAGAKKVTSVNVHGGHKAFSSESVLTNGTAVPFKIPMPTVTQSRLPNNKPGLVNASVSSSQNIPSATDSMKLLANNKTDDQKIKPSFAALKSDNTSNKTEDNDQDFNIRHYNYEGSIYAMSRRSINDSDYDNPLINRMNQMVIERTRHSHISIARKDSFEGVTPNNNIPSKVERNSTALQSSNNRDIVDGLFLPEILNTEEEDNNKSPSQPVSAQPESTNRTHALVANIKEVNESSTSVAGRDILASRVEADTDGGTDALNKAGKQIATSAFQFLDNYLSEDEGGESLMDSPPLSPAGRRVEEVY